MGRAWSKMIKVGPDSEENRYGEGKKERKKKSLTLIYKTSSYL